MKRSLIPLLAALALASCGGGHSTTQSVTLTQQHSRGGGKATAVRFHVGERCSERMPPSIYRAEGLTCVQGKLVRR